jgi:hypothetical protein
VVAADDDALLFGRRSAPLLPEGGKDRFGRGTDAQLPLDLQRLVRASQRVPGRLAGTGVDRPKRSRGKPGRRRHVGINAVAESEPQRVFDRTEFPVALQAGGRYPSSDIGRGTVRKPRERKDVIVRELHVWR